MEHHTEIKFQDEIETEVNRIWLESPGIGVKDLMQKLESLNLTSEITKKRVKAAKQAIPYAFVPRKIEEDGEGNGLSSLSSRPPLTEKQKIFVEQKIQERTSVRSLRRYKDADNIMKGLTAMGVVLNDGMRTWTIGEKQTSDDGNENNENIEHNNLMENQSKGVPCKYCNRYFASKNLVFRHLRDVSTSCGNAIFANGEKVPDAPSAIKKREKQEAAKLLRRKKTGRAKEHADPRATLWFGDLPIPYTRLGGQYKRLRAVLREFLPRDVPQPWIKKVVRKAYRKGGKMVNDEDGDENNGAERGEYFGYAIIVFRDAEEAMDVKASMDGARIDAVTVFPDSVDCSDIPSFSIKVKHVQNGRPDENVSNTNNKESSNSIGENEEIQLHVRGGQDPPLRDQLWPLPMPDLQERLEYLRGRLKDEAKNLTHEEKVQDKNDASELDEELKPDACDEHEKMILEAIELYEAVGARTQTHFKGRTVPEPICKRLLNLLQNVRWPAASHRKGLTSERYLVLQTNVANDRFYNDLRQGCRELMQWVDPEYYYSGIAVTKNFVASPHIDDRDQSFQYAISLGNFTNGGQLCVESFVEDEKGRKNDCVNVVETHNRIARVDGRHVHWVRSWEGGDRYSLIFYDTSDRHQTEVMKSGIDLSFIEEHN